VHTPILKLFPPPSEERPLEGTYLDPSLREQATARNRPWVIANFITSLDGRIAVAAEPGLPPAIPKDLTNPRDWRLFQEIAIQADLWLISGHYLREHAEGAAQEFDPLRESGQSPLILTSERAPRGRVEALASQGAEVLMLGDDRIEGSRLLDTLHQRGHSLIYSTAGPRIAHMLLRQGVLDRLYLTIAARMLGGVSFATILEGERLMPPADWSLQSLYFDPHALDGAGQLYACLDRRTAP